MSLPVEDVVDKQLSGEDSYNWDHNPEDKINHAIDLQKFLLGGRRYSIVIALMLEGYTHEEISDCLGITRMTVHRDVRKAKELLKRRI